MTSRIIPNRLVQSVNKLPDVELKLNFLLNKRIASIGNAVSMNHPKAIKKGSRNLFNFLILIIFLKYLFIK